MVIGVIRKIELWDQDTLDKYENSKDSFTDDDFDDLADQINF
jgi:DNA-binding transcriptional regulator/RsmH inhibitor MraZ